MQETTNIPSPGTPEAIEQGCTCPVFDNCHGAGVEINGERCWWITEGCPLHSVVSKAPNIS